VKKAFVVAVRLREPPTKLYINTGIFQLTACKVLYFHCLWQWRLLHPLVEMALLCYTNARRAEPFLHEDRWTVLMNQHDVDNLDLGMQALQCMHGGWCKLEELVRPTEADSVYT
jgi:hypothetical protein